MITDEKKKEILKILNDRFPSWLGFSDERFKEWEVNYKRIFIKDAKKLLDEKVLSDLLSQGKYDEFLEHFEKIGKHPKNNFFYLAVPKSGDLGILYQDNLNKPEFCKQLYNLIYGKENTEIRLQNYIEYIKKYNLPNKWTFPTFFLFVCHPDKEMFIKPSVVKWFVQFIDDEREYEDTPSGDYYAHFVKISKELKGKFVEYNPRDMVDIQSLIWGIKDISGSISLLTKYLNEFKHKADEWFKENTFVLENYKFFKEFFKSENLRKLEWKDIQKMGEHIYAFLAFPLAKKKALGKPNHSIEHYRKSFIYLAHGKEPLEERLENFISKEEYKLDFFGESTMSEIIGYLFADKYIFFNRRDKWALDFLKIRQEYKNRASFIQKLTQFNESIEIVRTHYKKIVGEKTDLPLNIEVDQFFSYLYEKHKVANYWIFQANPNRWDVIKALKEGNIRTWQVNQNKKKIKTGDKFILYVGGKKAGIYGTGIVESEIFKDAEEDVEKDYEIVHFNKEITERVKVSIENNWLNNPISRDEIVANEILKNLKIGNQGTNLVATESQYEAILKMRGNNMVSETEKHKTEKDKTKENKGITLTSLNTILYGPPGTGKTFMLKDKYFRLFTEEDVLVTAEEFIREDIKNLSWWQVVAMVLMDAEGNKTRLRDIYEHPLIKLKGKITTTKNLSVVVLRSMELGVMGISSKSNNVNKAESELFYRDENSFWHVNGKIVDEKFPEIREILQKYKNYVPERKSKKRYKFVTFHQSYSYEEFVEGLKPIKFKEEGNDNISYEIVPGVFKRIADEARENPDNNYALFIDEINRGNISKIFGELITLIEDDKRAGNENEMSVVLPYSGENFSVPNNLYIIGTMNTADRSIALIDIALRRRFEFKEVLPDPGLLKDIDINGIRIEKLLKKINERIEFLYDRDHTIGHSYFLELKRNGSFKDLCNIFSKKIIPLLQEYFFDDWEKIQIVLGDHIKQFHNGIREENLNLDDDFNKYRLIQSAVFKEHDIIGFDHEDYEDLLAYRVNPKLETGTLDSLVFKKIYDNNVYKEINKKLE